MLGVQNTLQISKKLDANQKIYIYPFKCEIAFKSISYSIIFQKEILTLTCTFHLVGKVE